MWGGKKRGNKEKKKAQIKQIIVIEQLETAHFGDSEQRTTFVLSAHSHTHLCVNKQVLCD